MDYEKFIDKHRHEIEEPKNLIEMQEKDRETYRACPRCNNLVEIDYCYWECCKASRRDIYCPHCDLEAVANKEDWNNGIAIFYDMEGHKVV